MTAGGTFEGRGLDCVRGERVVFQDLDFSVEAGAALMVTGPNGSGKSSLLRLAAGLLQPARGHLLWDGAEIAGAIEAHRARLAFVGHLDALKPSLTVAENLSFWSALSTAHGRLDDAALDAALDRFGLAALAGVAARLLSAGERRRAALARLAVSSAALWLLDEPTAALDAASTATLIELLEAHRVGGGLVVVASHVDLGLGGAAALDLGARPGPTP